MLYKIKEYYKKRGVIIPDNEFNIISELLQSRTLKKKEFFYKTGDTNTSVAYILKGSLRVFITDSQKKEFNRFFAFEDWWVGEYHQVMNNLPSKTSVQALEETDIIEITKEALDIILEKCPVFTRATFNFYLKSYANLLEKEELKKTLTIEELYLDILKNKPQVLKRIPLYHIASYLGVKPESLSRVKKKFQ
ncbi:hypothetical protein AXE80_09850 [Wenyingzhuangia fucanilytica]|uniref:Cyclic nucleotide-binding domain-containing protein n=1 Tax=Wenyingzhuangia fucanilytica TaxID=1790137 RepID=A0A1B1Y701_9FLAO|nr:Crp/Fnr family transcriptional regulator [Wenyingzhuangia fucanilytica]ANW96562.1 hypothetical protein AXE80_09850 [Wenyingzhuangia fucanilytica]